MTITSKMEKGIIDKIDYIILTFEDNTEIRIGEIVDYDLDLDNKDYSSFSFTTASTYNKLLVNFKRKGIKNLRIITSEIDINDIERTEKLSINIHCDMEFRRCRITGDKRSCGKMCVELQGMVI